LVLVFILFIIWILDRLVRIPLFPIDKIILNIDNFWFNFFIRRISLVHYIKQISYVISCAIEQTLTTFRRVLDLSFQPLIMHKPTKPLFRNCLFVCFPRVKVLLEGMDAEVAMMTSWLFFRKNLILSSNRKFCNLRI
jgi:hypothetical protein